MKYIYNNEALCCVGIISTLNNIKKLNYAKIFLVAPLIFNSQFIRFLNSNSDIKSIEDLTIKKGYLFTKFDSQYKESILLTIKALLILENANIISIDNNIVYLNQSVEFDEKQIGKRGTTIKKASRKLSKLLSEDDAKLYLHFRVIL